MTTATLTVPVAHVPAVTDSVLALYGSAAEAIQTTAAVGYSAKTGRTRSCVEIPELVVEVGALAVMVEDGQDLDGPVRTSTTRLERYARFAAGPDAEPAHVANSAATLATQLPILGPENDEDLLQEAGFDAVEPFYAALTLRGWLAHA